MKKILFLLVYTLWFGKMLMAQSLSSYVEKYSPIAQEIMSETQIPASLILGVAIHESAYGKSKIARYLNNHFGIKGKNYSKKIRSAYKGYPTVKDSYRHFARIIKSKPYFSQLVNQPVEKWVRRVHKGYAKSPTWSSQVLNIIKSRNLKRFDNQSTVSVENDEPETVDSLVADSTTVQVHTIERGETLSSIAKKYRTTVENLKKINNLNSSKIRVGKRLQIQ